MNDSFLYFNLINRRGKLSFWHLTVLFLLISWIGWCMETVYFWFRWDCLADRGFLTLPLCTIYGFTVAAVYLCVGTPTRGRLQPIFRRAEKFSLFPRASARIGLFLLYYILVTLLPTIAEYLTAWFFDTCFGIRLWNYTAYAYNLFGYVCLKKSLVWGGIITFAMVFVWPLLERAVRRVSPAFLKQISLFFIVLLLADFSFNLLYLLCTGRHFLLCFV